ncbi:ATP-binding protein [Zhaonella formicivorans]|jgi:anti-sigma regulatory factor (Ser/Thr protein kinase)|uniref:ATP-binding protein n=1 Tax=Zhaonella formicivorans TaxID=2528593 RepID=UPI0010D3BBB7|nr:ATP-binding protein [Zhaonella formicivorans]
MEELALHLLDLMENSLEAGATAIEILIDEDEANNLLTLVVADNGKGMEPDVVAKVTNPFVTSRTTRKVGLGLSLLKATAESCGGELQIVSQAGKGTKVTAKMIYNHWDRPPLGDIASTIAVFLASSENIALSYSHLVNERIFTFDSREFSKILDGIPQKHPQVINWLRSYFAENLDNIRKGGRG